MCWFAALVAAGFLSLLDMDMVIVYGVRDLFHINFSIYEYYTVALLIGISIDIIQAFRSKHEEKESKIEVIP